MGVENNIAEGWGKYSIGDFGKIITGKTPSKNNPEDWGDKIDFITPSDIPNNLKVISNCVRKLSEQGENRFNRMILPSGSVIVTCIGSDMGKVVMNKNKSLTNQQINSIIINDTYSNEFIYYLLKRSHKVLRRAGEGSGSTMPLLNKSHFESLSFEIPPLPEQKAIAKVLTAFDDKIELLQAQNKTLETMAQTIFKEWFGKYQIGDDLPDGWRFGKLGEIANLKSGYAFKSNDFVEENDKKALKIKDLKGDGKVSLKNVSCVSDDITKLSRVQYFKLKEGDIVLAMSGNTTGKIGVTPPHSNEVYLNQRVGKFFMIKRELNSFLFTFLMSGNYEEKILSMGYGSAQPNVSPSLIENIDIIYPNEHKLLAFLNISDPIFNKVLDNNAQVRSLTRTRDTLLPKLMSGQVRVNNIKQPADA